jgi:hypothetical protein
LKNKRCPGAAGSVFANKGLNSHPPEIDMLCGTQHDPILVKVLNNQALL